MKKIKVHHKEVDRELLRRKINERPIDKLTEEVDVLKSKVNKLEKIILDIGNK